MQVKVFFLPWFGTFDPFSKYFLTTVSSFDQWSSNDGTSQIEYIVSLLTNNILTTHLVVDLMLSSD